MYLIRMLISLGSIFVVAGPHMVIAVAGERIALVVGNGAYVNTSPLPNPPADAALMARTLKGAGFSVTLVTNADQGTMKRSLLEFGRRLRGSDIEAGLFFYAGHGVQVRGLNYLVPVNANITSEDEIDLEGIDINDFLRVMNSSNSKINIIVLDACRNNPFARSFRSVSRGLAPVDAPKGTLIAYATAPGDVAMDGNGANSPYTLALSEAISMGAGKTIESVFKTARRSVLQATGEQQVPWETSSVTGDFYFHDRHEKKDGANQPPQSPPATITVPDDKLEQSSGNRGWRAVGQLQEFALNTIAAVQNGPANPSRFRIDRPMLLHSIMTYHWNNGRGSRPGSIRLEMESSGEKWLWEAYGAPGQGGVPNAYWHAEPGIILQPGTYLVKDSKPSTWATNAEVGNRGIFSIKLQEVIAVDQYQ